MNRLFVFAMVLVLISLGCVQTPSRLEEYSGTLCAYAPEKVGGKPADGWGYAVAFVDKDGEMRIFRGLKEMPYVFEVRRMEREYPKYFQLYPLPKK